MPGLTFMTCFHSAPPPERSLLSFNLPRPPPPPHFPEEPPPAQLGLKITGPLNLPLGELSVEDTTQALSPTHLSRVPDPWPHERPNK